MAPSSTRNASRNAMELRESYKDYFCNEGSVPWQYDIINYTSQNGWKSVLQIYSLLICMINISNHE